MTPFMLARPRCSPERPHGMRNCKIRNVYTDTQRSAVDRNYRGIAVAGEQTAASSLALIFHIPIYEGTSF